MDDKLHASTPKPMPHGSSFPSTHWTTLLVPIRERANGAADALERLCEIYRPPVVGFARHFVNDPGEAEDIAHDFIFNLLRREDLTRVRRENGKFRSFLCAGIRNHVANHISAKLAQKRGGVAPHVSLDELAAPPADPATAETEFFRRWIQTAVAEAIRSMEMESAALGKAEEFADFKEFALSKKGDAPRAELAAKYGVTINAIDAKISRFRRRFRELLRELISQTVSSPEEVDEEIRFLMRVLSG